MRQPSQNQSNGSCWCPHRSCREAEAGAVITVGDTTAAAFGCLLAYLYSDELELVDAVVIDVMRKAQEFGLSVTSCDLVY